MTERVRIKDETLVLADVVHEFVHDLVKERVGEEKARSIAEAY